MKPFIKLKWLAALLLIAVNAQSLLAQTKANIFDDKTPITWLGVDYSLTKFIGPAFKFQDKGQVTNEEFRDKYTVGWNQLFIKEQKKYDVAKYTHRDAVKYAVEVTEKANAALKKEFFSNDPSDFKKMTEADITNAVKSYDFQNNEGIGLMFFVEGMSKAQESEGIWVTFVDMKSKTVLFTSYQSSSPGGFGFTNYWMKPLLTALKSIDSNYNTWKKS